VSKPKRKSWLQSMVEAAVNPSPPFPKDIPDYWINYKTGKLFAAARIAHPQAKGLYYRQADPITPWVEKGYSTWSRGAWMETYATTKDDNRKWEFFGEEIELWPPSEDEDH